VDFTSLVLTDVSRHFGRRKVLNKVSLRCEAGEIVALLGPNGAGKSTLLSVVATLLEPSSGSVSYGGATARASGAALRARIGLLGHDLYIYSELSAD
jgi:ABC-type multidrug transport system ATPase subunit